MQDRKPRVLATRPIAQSIIDRAAQHGIDIQVIPFIQSSPRVPGEIAGIIRSLSQQDLVAVFTSVHAVKAVAPFLDRPAVQICCLSGATLRAVEDHFPAAEVLATAEDAQALAAKILENRAISEVHYFCGNMHLPQLPDLLASAGLLVNLHPVYETLLTPVAIDQYFDGIAFFSPSAVQSYRSLNRIEAGACLFAIGQTTAAALSGLNNRVVTSSFPHPDAMLDTIIEFYQSGIVPINIRNA